MIPPITIDTMGLSQEFDLTREDVDNLKEQVVKTITSSVQRAWVEEAKNSDLTSTRSQYINSIVVGEEGRFTNVISLVGTVPNMVESGASPFDIKEGFANSPKKVITRNKKGELGWYLTIPFVWAQSGAIGDSRKFSGVLPGDVTKLLKSKGTGSPITKNDLMGVPDEFRIPKVRKEVKLDSRLAPDYENKHSVYEGVTKQAKGSVMSFRRVSGNSDDDSWIHSGIQARNLADKAVQNTNIPEITGSVIDSFLDQIL